MYCKIKEMVLFLGIISKFRRVLLADDLEISPMNSHAGWVWQPHLHLKKVLIPYTRKRRSWISPITIAFITTLFTLAEI